MNRPAIQFGKLGGVAGIVLAAIGFLCIGIGFLGVSGNALLQAQLAYLMSGGIFGLAFVILGAAMLVVRSARDDRAMLEAKLDLLAEAVLEAGGRARPDAPGDLSGLVVAGTASYHVPGCRLVDGREETTYLTPPEAVGRGLKPCRVCQPELATPEVTLG